MKLKENEIIDWDSIFKRAFLKKAHDYSFDKNKDFDVDYIVFDNLEDKDFIYILPLTYKFIRFIVRKTAGGEKSSWLISTSTIFYQFFKYDFECMFFIVLRKKFVHNNYKYLLRKSFTCQKDVLINQNGRQESMTLADINKDIYIKYKQVYLQDFYSLIYKDENKKLEWDKYFNKYKISFCLQNETNLYKKVKFIKLNSISSDTHDVLIPTSWDSWKIFNSEKFGGEASVCCLGSKKSSYLRNLVCDFDVIPFCIISKFHKRNEIKFIILFEHNKLTEVYTQTNVLYLQNFDDLTFYNKFHIHINDIINSIDKNIQEVIKNNALPLKHDDITPIIMKF